MRIAIAIVMTIMLAGTAVPAEIAGVQIAPSVMVDHHSLTLNGSGIRKKFFVKVYIGSLYSARPLTTAAEALSDPGDKLIRMNFLYSRVEKGKIRDAFSEGFIKNSPDLADSGEVKRFLSLFTDDFRKGDVVDIFLGGDGTVTARHNGKVLGTLKSRRLAVAILAIYLGDHPADEDLKRGMLGKGE